MKQNAIIIGFAITLPGKPTKEEAIAIARMRRAGKAAAKANIVSADESILNELADGLVTLATLVRRARASAQNRED